jgi:hypothetical protein
VNKTLLAIYLPQIPFILLCGMQTMKHHWKYSYHYLDSCEYTLSHSFWSNWAASTHKPSETQFLVMLGFCMLSLCYLLQVSIKNAVDIDCLRQDKCG